MLEHVSDGLGSEDIPEGLEIRDKHLRICLACIADSVEQLWDGPNLLQHYTNHDLAHSQRLVEILGKLLVGYPHLLNTNERFVLTAAVYLHDIGMQSSNHAGLAPKTEYSVGELKVIGEKHNEFSSKMILESVSPTANLSLGLGGCKDYAPFIATIARYHRVLDLNDVQDTCFAGETIRLRLLAALLRLADALDQDFRRVNMDVLKLRYFPVESKLHWWAHHYVQGIDVRTGRIVVYFRFPEEYRGEQVIEAFRKKVCESITRILHAVHTILDGYGIKLHRDVTIGDEQYVSAGILEPLPDDLLEYIGQGAENREAPP